MRSYRRIRHAAVCGLLALLLSACANLDQTLSPVANLFVPPPLPARSPPPQPRPVERSIDTSTPAGVRAEIIHWFTRQGYHRAHVEALVDYAQQESGFRPCATNGASLRYLFQWTGERLRKLDDFTRAHGRCPPLDEQLAFADNELRTEPKYWCFWRAQTRAESVAALRRGFGRGSC